MIWVGRDLVDLVPTPLAIDRDTFHYTRLLKAPPSMALNTSGKGIHNSSGKPVAVPHHPHSREVTCLMKLIQRFLGFHAGIWQFRRKPA